MNDNSVINQLIEDHLDLVPKMVRALTASYTRLPHQEYEELAQTGYLALCHAAAGYDGKRPFIPYARSAIRNAIYDYWRECKKQKAMFCSLDAMLSGDKADEHFSCPDTRSISPEQQTLSRESTAYLINLENQSSGIIQKGITSLRLQQNGYTSTELARLYGVPSNHIRAWQSKAKKRLRQDPELYALLA